MPTAGAGWSRPTPGAGHKGSAGGAAARTANTRDTAEGARSFLGPRAAVGRMRGPSEGPAAWGGATPFGGLDSGGKKSNR